MYNYISDIILRNYNPTVAFAAKIFAILCLRKPLKYVKLGKARTKENWHVLRQHKKILHFNWFTTTGINQVIVKLKQLVLSCT